jgi:hypothetical protein
MRRRAGERLDKRAKELRAERRRLIGWRYIPGVLIYCAVCSVFIVYLVWASDPEAAWMLAGFAGGVSLLFLYMATDTVSVNRIESAAVAEWNTSNEVRKLHRKGWRIIDNLPMDGYDIDHIAIGPGGVVVLETKWTSDGLIDEKGKLNQYGHRAVDQAERNVPRINALLKGQGSEARVAHACVVSWGMRSIPEPLTSKRRGITVTDGAQLCAFLTDRETIMSATDIEAAFAALNCYLTVRLEDIRAKAATAAKSPSADFSRPNGGR